MNQLSSHIIEKIKPIKCLICDVDGVLTNGILYMADDGSELKAFHVHDGMGLKFLMKSGIHVAVITTSQTALIDHRMKQLGIQHYYKGQVSKLEAYKDLKEKLQLQDHEFAYIGDDWPDWEVMEKVGLKITVADATTKIQQLADWKTEKKGGLGAVREVCEAFMAVHNTENLALIRYLHPDKVV